MGGDPPPAVLPEQCLGDDRPEGLREHRPDQILLRRREYAEDAVDGLRGGAGVQRPEHEVAGLGGGQGEPDRLQVAHLADEDDVRVLAQGRTQRLVEAKGVAMDLALAHEALPALVDEFDRVLDGEDVAVPGCVPVVDHRGQGGRFPAPRRSGDQHQPARSAGEVLEDLRRVQLVERRDHRRDDPEHRAGAAVVVEYVDAKAGEAGDLE